ncbi:DUF7544 domain-containing protein [Candidatus Leptofilum sp.]|uniref:DUF7544 domain-containing protein n=1 Tax=Candidatus Leptofilum sp. TaxID=3241576 RepID=UPI003B5BB871
MDFGKLFRRGWEVVWQNKFLFILGFLAALGGSGGGSSGGNFNYNIPSSSTSTEPFPPEIIDQFNSFWADFGGLVLGLGCFLFILGIVFWLIRLAAQGGLIEAVDRIEAGEKMSFGSAFSAGVARIGGLVGLNLLLNLPFILFGLVIGGGFAFVGFSLFQEGGNMTEAMAGTISILAICGGLLACLLVPLGLIVTFLQPFAQRGLVIKQLGVMDSIRHGWDVLRQNLGDILLLGIAFFVLGILVGFVSLFVMVPLAFLAAGPVLFDLFQGNQIDFGMSDIVLLAFGGICLGLAGAAINSILTAYRSATVTLAYQQFIQKDGFQKDV